MPAETPSVLAEIAELIKAAASLLWPILGFYVVIRHEKQLRDVFSRLRKGKLLGQEIELDSSLKELQSKVAQAQDEQPTPDAIPSSGAISSSDHLHEEADNEAE